MTINEAQDEVVEEFSDFTDWMDRYQMLIDLGNDLEILKDQYKTENNLIDGCQSRVWLQCDYKDGKLVFTADSDALIVKGIIALLIQVMSGHTPSEILNADLYFIEKIGLREHGFDLHVCDVTAAHFPLLGCFGSCRFDVFGAAGGKSCQGDQCREEEFFHVLSVVLVKNIALKGKGRKKSLLLSSHIQN